MCGIYASISRRGVQSPSPIVLQLLCNRGPDLSKTVERQTDCEDGSLISLSFTSTVLALRGSSITVQPLQDPASGSLLCWNGEAWKIGGDIVTGNDGQAVLNLLAGNSNSSVESSIRSIQDGIESIAGPFAFVYFDKANGLVYFGRDRLGRRSLLVDSESNPETVAFSSVADPGPGPWREVEADGIYVLALGQAFSSSIFISFKEQLVERTPFPIYKLPWATNDTHRNSGLSIGKLNHELPTVVCDLNVDSDSVLELEHHIYRSLKLRVLDIPFLPSHERSEKVRLAILFSGGLDCTVLARVAHDLLPDDLEIDLLNVAFENPRVVSASKQISKKNTSPTSADDHTSSLVEQKSAYDLCPDRITGRNSLDELRRVCPGRVWRFVEINVPYTETLNHRPKVISLIYPHNTEMDLSIAYALYFAARGSGLASSEPDCPATSYTSPAPVVLSGLGADELFAGYTRHATAFNRRGYSGLLEELELDVNRLGKRNLGRDDRVIANWGREARYPYLDESLVQWALNCPVWKKCGFTLGIGTTIKDTPDIEPGKLALRLLAWKLGMRLVAKEKKRAIQFGARTAKMETGKSKGTTLIN